LKARIGKPISEKNALETDWEIIRKTHIQRK